jgi:ComF family protein
LSIWRPSFWRPVLARLLPQDCLLCGGGPNDALLCPTCQSDLPRLSAASCPICLETTPGGTVCGVCLKQAPHFDATLAAFRYHFPVDKLVQALKYGHRLAIAEFLAEAMLRCAWPTGELIVPVPLARPRLRQRGFNQAVEIARLLARRLELPLQLAGCTRSRDTVAQATLPWKERQKNIRHAFECSLDLSDKSIIVVDDVMTTGATLDEFARTLKRHGATRVTNWVAARALRD